MRNSAAVLLPLVAILGAAPPAPALAQTIDDVGSVAPFVDLCVTRALRGQDFQPRREATMRLSFRRDGTIIGKPAVTFSRPGRGEAEQERFIGAISAALARCTPLPFSNGLGAAIAGRIFTFRYTITSAKDQTI